MADKTSTIEILGRDYVMLVAREFKANITAINDTLTFSDFTSIKAITAYKASDGVTAVTFSIATNVATCTLSGISDQDIFGIITGVLKK